MQYRIIAIRLSPPSSTSHEHIVAVKTSLVGERRTDAVVADIDGGDTVTVEVNGNRSVVGVVRPAGRPAYLRTYANGQWNDNLLSLPRF